MVDCTYFKTDFLNLESDYSKDIQERDAFTILMCVSGEGEVSTTDGSVNVKKGETVLIPACAPAFTLNTAGIQVLEITI